MPDRRSLRRFRLARRLLVLGLPIALQTGLQTSLNIIDRIMVGQLGEVAINAVAVAGQILYISIVVSGAVTTGVGVVAAQHFGARDLGSFLRIALNGLYAVLVGGVVITVAVLAFRRPLMGLLIPGQFETIREASSYLLIVMSGFTAMLIGMLVMSLLHAAGDTRTPMKISILQVGLNTLLNWMLIFGIGPFPTMGVQGAALGTLISLIGGVVLLSAAFMMKFQTNFKQVGRRIFRLDAGVQKKIFALGAPISLDGIAWQGAALTYFAILGRIGEFYLAAFLIAQTIRNMMFIPLMGMARGASIAVGQTLGGAKPRQAQAVTGVALRMGLMSNAAMALGVGIFAPQLAGLFDVAPFTHDWAVFSLRVIALLQFFETTNVILPFVLRGGGDAMRVFFITAASFWCVGIPLAWLLGLKLDFGLPGVLAAMACEYTFKSAMLYLRYRGGRWRKRLVED